MNDTTQPGILAPVPAQARYLSLAVTAPAHLAQALQGLAALADGQQLVAGLNDGLVRALGRAVPGLKNFSAPAGSRVAVAVADAPALWLWLRGADRGDLLHATRRVQRALGAAFRVEQVVDAFCHRPGDDGLGKDLTGYEDGTENPTGAAARAAALVAPDAQPGLAGASFVAVQQWQHDLDAFDALDAPAAQDRVIGRRRSDNAELDDAPAAAHVKRTAQEDFQPEAFVLRRSMPWVEGLKAGLMFVAFGRSLDAFEAQWRRMSGAEDGITDALFAISRPLSTGYFWCPPIKTTPAGPRLDLQAIGL